VNVLGCLLLGLMGGFAESRQALGPAARAFLLIGVLGGFTTFSTFAYETLGLAQDSGARAAASVAAQVILGLAAAAAGYAAARAL
jgi:CrcB protein